MGKKYLVEQVEEEEKKKKEEEKEEPKKEQLIRKKEQENSGIPQKDLDPALTKKVEEPSVQSGQSMVIPTDPLTSAKKLTEQMPLQAEPAGGNAEIIALLQQILAKISGGSAQGMAPEEEEPQLTPSLETVAVGFEGDTPSGPSLGKKTDIDGGLPEKDTDKALDKKVEEPSTQSGQSMVIPKEPLSSVKQLSENLSGRKVLIGGKSSMIKETVSVEKLMKEYAGNNGREVC